MRYLDTFKEKKLQALQLTYQAAVCDLEAEYALKMHTALEFGKGGDKLAMAAQAGATQHMAAPATQQPPAQTSQQPAAAQPQGQQAGNGNGHSGIFCSKCNVELQDKPGRNGGAPWTAQKAAEYSVKQHGAVLCYNCANGR